MVDMDRMQLRTTTVMFVICIQWNGSQLSFPLVKNNLQSIHSQL